MDQRELLPIEHRSTTPERCRARKGIGHSVNPEAIYAAKWREINKDIPHLLGRLLARSNDPKGWGGEPLPAHVSRRDAVVAATIIQWLGTNVGSGFVMRCQQLVNEAIKNSTTVGIMRARERRRVDDRTPLQRRKAVLDATRTRLKKASQT